MTIAWHIEECLFFSMEVSEIWYLHSFFFYEFFKSVMIHPGAFWYSGVNCDTLKKTAKKGKSEHMIWKCFSRALQP